MKTVFVRWFASMDVATQFAEQILRDNPPQVAILVQMWQIKSNVFVTVRT